MMAPTPRSNKFQEVDGTPCHGVKMQSQNLFRRVNIETPGEKSRTAFIPRQRLVTPLISNTLNHLISNVENNQRKSEKPVSPNLEMLRMTPGLQQKQRLLQEKHLKAKSLVDKIPVGGGVSLWPEMDDMRLTKREVLVLIISSLVLIFAVVTLFEYLHGPLLLHLNYYSGRVRTFHGYHPITSNSEVALNQSLIRWHKDFRKLLGNVQRQFEAPFHCVHVTFILYIMLYIVGITMLLYYLVDNMIQKSRLTPKRIKIWLTLLVVTATWTFLMIKLLVAAHHLERAIEGTVYTLIEELADLAVTGHDLRCYHDIVTYWQFRCLPPTTHGILNIFGLIKVRDISFYFHYYSLPVITALCTPVIKLLLALKTIYSRPHVY
ncbi:uncharacterized protein LOC119970645 isoform X1 [Scyliorhinus canicula]|uniref:uncharacterized protein LOC119970645 isoform X1 n=1 Tax=Scyliorhinus canicula TaxID=7830 RepID=UPI0018F504D6|nr:uncharacterized protein LOC119970645 isoform X1 [Scyliorhinus canicula]